MKIKELKELLNHSDRHDDDDVMVIMAVGGIGPRPATEVTSGGFGFDWDNGRFLLNTKTPLVPRSDEQHVWQMSLDFIYSLAKYDRRTRLGKTYKTEYAEKAIRILEKAGYDISKII